MAIVGLISFMLPICIKIMNSLKYQQALVAAQRDARVFFQILTHDIINAPEIDGINTNESMLQLRSYDTQTYGMEKKELFNRATFGWITYAYHDDRGGIDHDGNGKIDETYILRISSYPPIFGERPVSQKYLLNIVVPPDADPSTPDWIFKKAENDNQTMKIQLKLRFPFMREVDKPLEFATVTTLRKAERFE